MDPNTALENARVAAGSVVSAIDGNGGDLTTSADALAEAFQALDQWLSSGGFLPEAWAGKS